MKPDAYAPLTAETLSQRLGGLSVLRERLGEPSTWRVRICERSRCLPHMKHDMVAPLNEAEARNGEPEGLDL